MSATGKDTCSREVSLVIFLKEGMGFTEANMMATVREEHNRSKDTPKLERLIEKMWVCCLEKHPCLVNRLKFRLHTTVEDDETGLTHFKMGLTSCKEHLGTNCLLFPHDIRQLLLLGNINHCNRGIYMAQWFGVGALVLTDEKKYIFVRRNYECCEMRKLLDRPGGAPDPGIVPLDPGEYDLAKAKSEDLVHEIFASAVRGVTEEVGIPSDALENVELLGLAINKTKGDRPTAEFAMTTTWPMEKVLVNYNKRRHKHCCSTAAIVFTSEQEVKCTPLSQSMFFKGLAPSAKGAILLLREQEKQLKEVEREKNRQKPSEAEPKPAEGEKEGEGEGEGEGGADTGAEG